MKVWNIVTILLLASLCGCSQRTERTAAPKTVGIDTVRAYEAHKMMEYPGRVQAAREVNLAFKVAGTLQQCPVGEGDFVREGELIASLDERDYRIQLDAAQAEYDRIRSEAERVMALYDDGAVTPDAYDKARYGLQQIAAKLEHCKDQLADTRIYAPFDGFVQRRYMDPPAVIGAGMPVLTLLSAEAPEIEIHIPGSTYVRRSSFERFHARFDVWQDRVLPLKLLGISPKANANQLYTLRLSFAGADAPYPSPGMNAMVTIACTPDSDTRVLVPATAVFTRNGGPCVWVYLPDRRSVALRSVAVESLRGNGDAVLSKGLTEGELIVWSGVHRLTEGEQVEPLPSVAPTNVGGLL